MKKFFYFTFLFFIIIAVNPSNSFSQSGWVVQSTPFPIINDFQFINSQTGFIVGVNGNIAKTSNGGNSWTMIPISLNLKLTSVNFLNNNTGVVWGYKNAQTEYPPYIVYLFKTTNGGAIWDSVYHAPGYLQNADIFMENKDSIVFSFNGYTDSGIVGSLSFSNDGGNTINVTSPNYQAYYALKFLNLNTGWVCFNSASDFGHYSSGLYKTINSGINWNKIYLDTVSVSYQPVTIYDNCFIDQSTGYIGGDYGKFKKTTNNGSQWQDLSISPRLRFDALHFFNENTGFALLYNNYTADSSGLYRTTSGGLNWIHMTNIPIGYIQKFQFVNDQTGWATCSSNTSDILIKTTTGGITKIELNNSVIPIKFLLDQNFPNPFNPTTKINYDLPVSEFVSLKVYDVVGNEIETLVSEHQNAGSYSVSFNAVNYPSGVYFYKLATNSFSETKKMLLLK